MGEPNAEVKVVNEEAEAKPQQAHKNGKKAEVGGGTSFFTWFMVLALLGVWTSVAVVYFDLVDYQGVIAKAKDLRYNLSEVLQGKLVSYDADGDGDFDVEDAKVLLDENSKEVSKRKGELSHAKDVGLKLREALKQQLTIIHERVEARKIAKLALAEVRNILAKEEEERTLNRIREESEAKAWERAEARLKEEGERIEKEDVEKAMERIRKEKEEREKMAESEEAKKTKKVENDEVKEKPELEKKSMEKPVNENDDGGGKKAEKDGKGKESKKAAAKKKQ
ncbi:aspartyl/asparaginyl beta-hydroxylase isoform X8 [Danio rerio]|uniref:Aspartyl/asparaginyl beta-hydroxylase isoform X8 n=1 Tax=Danio rerio TaxID=7955 RepID=A0AC58GF97_DANRE|nr:aspartate beta-hydroxylase isoform X5 [Danio rerio]|eukprot:XP_021334503.1 aspartate beta-hydroxylase isoform X5 [Danio rerio]